MIMKRTTEVYSESGPGTPNNSPKFESQTTLASL